MSQNTIVLIHGLEYWVEQMRLMLMSRDLCFSRDYFYEHGYKIQPLEGLVPIEGSWGANVPYLGYVEVRMLIPGISSF